MSSNRRFGSLGLFVLLALGRPADCLADPPPASTPEAVETPEALLDLAGEGFKIRQSDHFMIAYDSSYEHLRPLVGRVEGVYNAVWRLCQASNLSDQPPPKQLPILFFGAFDDYRDYAATLNADGSVIAGFYHHVSNVATFYNTSSRPDLKDLNAQIDRLQKRIIDSRRDRSRSRSSSSQTQAWQRQVNGLKIRRDAFVERVNRLVIQHEVAHQCLFNAEVHLRQGINPGWLVEGLACQFEVPQTASHGGLGSINYHRLADVREAFELAPDNLRPTAEQRRTAFDNERFLPLEELVGDSRVLLRRDDPNLNYRYAQCWSLVFHLHRHQREAFSKYAALVRRRPPGVLLDKRSEIAEFEAAFGPIDEAFEDAWIKFILGIQPRRP